MIVNVILGEMKLMKSIPSRAKKAVLDAGKVSFYAADHPAFSVEFVDPATVVQAVKNRLV